MKSIKFIYILIPVFFLSLITTSCSNDDDDDVPESVNEVAGLSKIQDITNATHTIELFNT